MENKSNYKLGDKVIAIGAGFASHYMCGDIGEVTDVTSRSYPRIQFPNWHGWPLPENIRPATEVEVAEDNLKAATEAVDVAAQELEAAREAERKAEAEAKKIKAEDIKPGAMFLMDGSLRLVVGDALGGFNIVCPLLSFEYADCGENRTEKETAEYMNSWGYTKTTKTLKDFL